jgi:pimeloyl-ACP methyl ester carboxylesterase
LDIPTAASRITSPWLILHGLDDTTVPPDEARTLAKMATDARMTLVDGAGHTFQARHPFESSPPELDEAVRCTVRHFERHLISGDT